jgi:hypothetical protein
MNTAMKNIVRTVALGLLLAGAASLRAEGADPAARQLALAARCEKKATDLQASIDAQLKLKADNLKQWQLRKSPMSLEIAAADRKYDATLADLKAEQADWADLARFHRLQAKELQTAEIITQEPAVN